MLWQTAYMQTLLDKWTPTYVNTLRTPIVYSVEQTKDCSWLEIHNAGVHLKYECAIEVLASRLVNQKPWHIKYSIIITINL